VTPRIMRIRPRPKQVTTLKRNKAWTTDQYPHPGGISIAYRFYPDDEDGSKWAAFGVCVSSPLNQCYHGKKVNRIARARLEDSPVRLQFEGFESKLLGMHVRSAFRTILIEEPKWEHVDDLVLRPGRFTERWGAPLVGPDGSLLTAYFDCKRTRRGLGRDVAQIPTAPSHWILRMPGWIQELV
jgi:hypothetical protein